MPKDQTFHFSVETAETYVSPTSPEECEEAYLRQRIKVDELIAKNQSPIEIYDLDSLIELSQTSRRTRNFEKKKKSQPARPLNKFLIFRKNYEEGVRKNKEDTKIDVVSKDAATEWKRWNKGSEVSVLFTEIATLAKKYHKYKYPDYKFQPNKKARKTILSSPESLKSCFSSPDMGLSSPESSSTSTYAFPTPSSSPSSNSVNSQSTEDSSRDFVMFDGIGNEEETLNLFINREPPTSGTEFPEAVQPITLNSQDSMDTPPSGSLEVTEQDSMNFLSSSSTPESSEMELIQQLIAESIRQQQLMASYDQSIEQQQQLLALCEQLLQQSVTSNPPVSDPTEVSSMNQFYTPCYLYGNNMQTVNENIDYSLQCNEVSTYNNPADYYPNEIATPKDQNSTSKQEEFLNEIFDFDYNH